MAYATRAKIDILPRNGCTNSAKTTLLKVVIKRVGMGGIMCFLSAYDPWGHGTVAL